MSGAAGRRAWIVAASIGAVEALKDQGVCRWNLPMMRLLHQRAKNNLKTFTQSQANKSSSSTGKNNNGKEMGMGYDNMKKVKKSHEESAKRVMDLNCWGPTTVRF